MQLWRYGLCRDVLRVRISYSEHTQVSWRCVSSLTTTWLKWRPQIFLATLSPTRAAWSSPASLWVLVSLPCNCPTGKQICANYVLYVKVFAILCHDFLYKFMYRTDIVLGFKDLEGKYVYKRKPLSCPPPLSQITAPTLYTLAVQLVVWPIVFETPSSPLMAVRTLSQLMLRLTLIMEGLWDSTRYVDQKS